MLKFIPVKYNVEELIEEIDICLGTKENYRTFDLVYLPISFKNEKSVINNVVVPGGSRSMGPAQGRVPASPV